MNKKVFKKKNVKDSIKDAFIPLYQKQPLNKININDLTQAINISRSAFYFYFDDIYDLYYQCETDAIQLIEGDLTDIMISTVTENRKKYIELVKANIERVRPDIEYLKTFVTGSESDHFHAAWYQSGYDIFERTLQFGVDMPKEKRNLIISFFAYGQMQLYSNWLKNGGTGSVSYMVEVFAQMLFKGAFMKTMR